MIDALMKRTTQVSSGSAHARGGVRHDSFIRWLLSRPVPRELVTDILRPLYDRASPVGHAHAAHIRALRRRGRRSEAKNSRSTHRRSRRVPAVVAVDADLWSADPWSRRVPKVVVDAEQFESLLEQVRDLRRLADEVTRVRERLDATDRALVD